MLPAGTAMVAAWSFPTVSSCSGATPRGSSPRVSLPSCPAGCPVGTCASYETALVLTLREQIEYALVIELWFYEDNQN